MVDPTPFEREVPPFEVCDLCFAPDECAGARLCQREAEFPGLFPPAEVTPLRDVTPEACSSHDDEGGSP